jgi:DNA-directed RNA polymerase specialized sigma24 family protein
VSQVTQVFRNGSTAYATSDDFCRIFSENMNRLYVLALLLTADARKAEQCFVAGIGDSVENNAVFREWAYAWARRTVIQQAIRMVEPVREKVMIAETEHVRLGIEPRLRAIVNLDPLERFGFVMSVLEGYSYHDCSLLLGCSRQVVMNARARALEHLSNSAEIVATCGEGRQSTDTLVTH